MIYLLKTINDLFFDITKLLNEHYKINIMTLFRCEYVRCYYFFACATLCIVNLAYCIILLFHIYEITLYIVNDC